MKIYIIKYNEIDVTFLKIFIKKYIKYLDKFN